jgi:hypothetical protein
MLLVVTKEQDPEAVTKSELKKAKGEMTKRRIVLGKALETIWMK